MSTVNRALLNSPLETVTELSGGRVIVVVLAGLLFGLAFQLLLANFGIAIGLSVFNLKPKPPSSDEPSTETADPDFNSIALIGVAAGLAIMLSIDGVLFAACFLAVKLSQARDPWLGAILGGLVWSVYLILLTWLSTSAVGTIADTVLGYTRTGLRRLFEAVGQLFKTESSATDSVDDGSDMIEVSRQQLLAAVEELDFTPILENTLTRLKSDRPSDLSQVVEEVMSRSVGENTIDWEQFVEGLQDQLSLPQPILKQIQQQVGEWVQAQGNDQAIGDDHPLQPDLISDLKHFLQTAAPSDLQPESLSTKLTPFKNPQSSPPWSRLQNIDFKGLLRATLRRVDLSDWDVQRIWQGLQSTQQQLMGTPQPEQSINIIQLDVEDYLLNTPLWNLTSDVIDVDFKDVIYDPDADPTLVHQQLTLLKPDRMQTLLQQREDVPSAKQAEIAEALERVQRDVLEQVQPASVSDDADDPLNQVQQKLESYCRYTTVSKLSPEGMGQKLESLLEEISVPASILAEQMPDLKPLEKILKRRKGLKPKSRQALLAAVPEAWQHLLPNPIQPQTATASIQKRLKAVIAEQMQGKDGESITFEDLKPHFIQLIDQPTSGLSVLNQYFGQVDWMSLAQELQGEYDFNPQSLNLILAKLRDEWQQVAKFPRRWARRTRRTAEDWQQQLQRYLKYQDRSALTGIDALEKDLRDLLDEAKVEVSASTVDKLSWPQSPSLPNKSEIVALLQERKDLTTAEIEQVSSQLTSTWEKLVDTGQSVQKQAQSSLDTVATKVREILNSLPEAAPDPAQLQETLEDVLPNIELSQIGDSLQFLARKAPTELLNESSWQQIRDRISALTQSTYQQLIHTRDDLEDTVKHQLSEQAEALQQHLLDQVDQLQTELQQQALDLKQDAQRQADKVRQSAAIAAWWLFAITLTSGMTSALSGFLAIRGLN